MTDEFYSTGEPDGVVDYLAIYGLHKKHDVFLEFAGRTTIFIADNGSGKTTALFILQLILRKQFSQISKFEYERIEIKFCDAKPVSFSPDDFEKSRNASMLRTWLHRGDVKSHEIFQLAKQVRQLPYSHLREETLFNSVARRLRVPSKVFYDRLIRFDYRPDGEPDLVDQMENSPILQLRSYLSNNIDASVLYLPTYRRVEQDMQHDVDDDDDGNEEEGVSIHFGMGDVKRKIERVTSQIRDHSIMSYGQISGQMLGQLAEDSALSAEMIGRLTDRGSVELVLARVGENVTTHQRGLILDAMDSGSLLENRHLSFFLSRLIEEYDQVRELDKALLRYASVCNGYLINKKMRYDSLNATLGLFEEITGDRIDLEHLSSGEKQILGVMAELYLGDDASYAVIFDEPELSLSVEWQKKILVDVAASEKCKLLVAATHSPFVFENDLDPFARALDVRFRPVKNSVE
ncbi:AAA family ATPase [Allorhizobium terrae]|uniref:ATP-binding protein n=1 Tax=Allorhizobium terrae TaxID=1848972 RepID=A0A4S3ZXX1_9HYPH|nr:AAA family ATPase [Allorhizobium terrae]THF50771.1 ATP-binding protein [Allorhizobium terrae]